MLSLIKVQEHNLNDDVRKGNHRQRARATEGKVDAVVDQSKDIATPLGFANKYTHLIVGNLLIFVGNRI